MTSRREEAQARMAETAGRYTQALDQADALIAAGFAEPDGDVTPSLGAALANPDDPLMLSADALCETPGINVMGADIIAIINPEETP